MRLIIGLGNSGRRYEGTRHNVGFDVLDEVAARRALEFSSAPAEAVMARTREGEPGVMLAKPLTFMNLSGTPVSALVRYYRIPLDDLLIVAEDVNLPLGRLRARARGSDGGHNGLRSVIDALGTQTVPRLRVGVGRGDTRRDLAAHVLARFETSERPAIREAVVQAADAVEAFIVERIGPVMNRFNGPPGSDAGAGEDEPIEGDEG